MRTKKSLLDLAVQLQTSLPSETASPAHNKCLLKAGQLEMVPLRTVRHSLPRAEGFELEIWTQVGMAAGLASPGTVVGGRRREPKARGIPAHPPARFERDFSPFLFPFSSQEVIHIPIYSS